MSGPHRKVLLGLWLSSVGLSVTAMAAVLVAGVELRKASLPFVRVNYFTVEMAAQKIQLGCLGLIALGLVIGFVGRCFCLAVPSAVKTAPARIWLTVTFEACSLLSAVGLIAVRFTLPGVPSFVILPSFFFSLITAYLARVQFLRFARALAEHADPSRLREVTAVQRLYLYVPGGFALAFGVRIGGVLINRYSGDGLVEVYTGVFAWLIATVTAVASVIAVWRWAGMLAGLRKAVVQAEVAELQAAAANDPDWEYRERYEQRLGLGRADLVEDSGQDGQFLTK